MYYCSKTWSLFIKNIFENYSIYFMEKYDFAPLDKQIRLLDYFGQTLVLFCDENIISALNPTMVKFDIKFMIPFPDYSLSSVKILHMVKNRENITSPVNF